MFPFLAHIMRQKRENAQWNHRGPVLAMAKILRSLIRKGIPTQELNHHTMHLVWWFALMGIRWSFAPACVFSVSTELFLLALLVF